MNRNSQLRRFIDILKERSLTLAFAESVTCGLAAHMLSTCKGTSDVFKGAVVCYNGKVKTGLLGVPAAMIEKYTAESRQVTTAMAMGLKKCISADIHAAITGLASAGASEQPGKPVGTVFFAVIYRRKVYVSHKVFKGSPLTVRQRACVHLYGLIAKYVKSAQAARRSRVRKVGMA